MPRYTPSPVYGDDAPPRPGVLLVNSGTPDSLSVGGVRRFLRGLLGDRRTVELPRALWLPLLYGIILTTRPPRVLPKYRRVWTSAGSPLLVISRELRSALAEELARRRGTPVPVALGMLYSSPGVRAGLEQLREAGAERIVVLPLFPQYSATTNAAAYDQVGAVLRDWRFLPELSIIADYHAEPGYIEALAASVLAHRRADCEHLLITFHGIPEKYVTAGDPYLRRCTATARALTTQLGLSDDEWTMSFQSRVGPQRWLHPYTDETLRELARRGVRRLTAVCPGFAVDCLETIDEIAVENGELFREAGGERLDYVPALNATPAHVSMLATLLERHAWPRA